MAKSLTLIIEEDIKKILGQELPWEKLKGSCVVISGASGFLPAYITETLIALNKRDYGIRIIGLVRNLEKAKLRFQVPEALGLELLEQDITRELRSDLPKPDFVIHAASQASPKYYSIDPVGTIDANTIGTRNLLEYARIHHCKSFLFFSSGEVYGTHLNDITVCDEQQFGYIDPTSIRACYGESKRLGEAMCVAWQHQFGLPTLIVRPFHTYGPGFALDDGRVFADFVSNIIEMRNILLKSNGLTRRSFCYIADATIGFFTVLLLGKAGEAYNIANPSSEISILDLARLLIRMFPERGLDVEFRTLGKLKKYTESQGGQITPSIEKIKQLGWEPMTPLETGFRRTVEHFEMAVL